MTRPSGGGPRDVEALFRQRPGDERPDEPGPKNGHAPWTAYFRPTRSMPAMIKAVPTRFGPTDSPRTRADEASRKTK